MVRLIVWLMLLFLFCFVLIVLFCLVDVVVFVLVLFVLFVCWHDWETGGMGLLIRLVDLAGVVSLFI